MLWLNLMKVPALTLLFLSAISLLVLSGCATKPEPAPAEIVVLLPGRDLMPDAYEEVEFTRDIKPLLEANCIRCHHDNSEMTGLSFQSVEQILAASSKERPILVPGDPEASTMFLVTVLPDYFIEAMPANGHTLTDEQRWKIYFWILQGAEWPKDESGSLELPPEKEGKGKLTRESREAAPSENGSLLAVSGTF